VKQDVLAEVSSFIGLIQLENRGRLPSTWTLPQIRERRCSDI